MNVYHNAPCYNDRQFFTDTDNCYSVIQDRREMISTQENASRYMGVLCAHTAPRTLRRLAVGQILENFLQSGKMKVELCLRRVSLVAWDFINSAGRIQGRNIREASCQDGKMGIDTFCNVVSPRSLSRTIDV